MNTCSSSLSQPHQPLQPFDIFKFLKLSVCHMPIIKVGYGKAFFLQMASPLKGVLPWGEGEVKLKVWMEARQQMYCERHSPCAGVPWPGASPWGWGSPAGVGCLITCVQDVFLSKSVLLRVGFQEVVDSILTSWEGVSLFWAVSVLS